MFTNIQNMPRYIRLLTYGDMGVGKTHFMATAIEHPDMSPLMIFNVDKGLSTVANKPGILYRDVSSIKEMREILNRPKNFENIRTIGVDSLTQLMSNEIENEIKQHGDDDKVMMKNWGNVLTSFRGLFSTLRTMPINLIMTASYRSQSEDVGSAGNVQTGRVVDARNSVGKGVFIRPAMSPGVWKEAAHFFDAIWFIAKAENGQINMLIDEMALAADGKITGKTRNVQFLEALVALGLKNKAGVAQPILPIGLAEKNYTMGEIYEIYKQVLDKQIEL